MLVPYLTGYDRHLREHIINGFQTGFALDSLFQGPIVSGAINNLKSARDHPDVIREKIYKELSAGRVRGPFDDPTLPDGTPIHVSPLGVVPKSSGGFRVIHHLSHPRGTSVNDFVPQEASSIRYGTIQDAIQCIKNLGNDVYLAKTDIESAFRIIPIREADQHLLGFTLDDKFYVDAVLPMGASSSCAIFDRFSSCLKWVAINKLGCSFIVHILDDFLFIVKGEKSCNSQLSIFLEFCDTIGVPTKPDKTYRAAKQLTFAGILLDTDRREARLPDDKLAKCREMIESFLTRRKVTLRELQSLIGTLNFACSVIVPGRPFLRRLIDLTVGVPNKALHISLTNASKKDLEVWLVFLKNFNGRSFFIDDRQISNDRLNLYTDSAGALGYGAIFGTHWFSGRWPEDWKQYSIAVLELYPIVAAISVWGEEWSNKTICFHSDNQSVVYVINRQTSRDTKIMTLVRKMVSLCLKYNIVFISKHIPGAYNVLPDLLSRFQYSKFRQAAPWADRQPTLPQKNWLPEGMGQL